MKKSIVWMDLEMTGLDPETDQIIEIATIVTDLELINLKIGPEIVIHQEPSLFESMDKWNRKHHTQSVLWDKVLKSQIKLAQAEDETLAFLKENAEEQCYLAGNTIWQDRRFLIKHMPKLNRFFHYRMLDVSTLKIIQSHWYPKTIFKKDNKHRAIDDIKESIEELKFYRKALLKEPISEK